MDWMGDAVAGMVGLAAGAALLEGLDGRPRYVSAERLDSGWGVVAHSRSDSSVRFRTGSREAAEQGARKLGRELGVEARGVDGQSLQPERESRDDFSLRL
jgi:hypothetical protein